MDNLIERLKKSMTYDFDKKAVPVTVTSYSHLANTRFVQPNMKVILQLDIRHSHAVQRSHDPEVVYRYLCLYVTETTGEDGNVYSPSTI